MQIFTLKAAAAGAAFIVAASVAPIAVGMTTANAAPASGRTYALENDGSYSAREQTVRTYRPHRLWVAHGGPDLYIGGLRWADWRPGSATGAGNAVGEDSTRFSLGRVRVYLSDSVYSTYYSIWYFAKLHLSGGHSLAHYWRWSWPDQEWLPHY